jgi:CubicO group peptidase (beta-lactamase class C family)
MARMRTILVALAVSVSASAPAAPLETERVDAFVKDQLPDSAAPGIAYAIVDGGESVARAAGKARKGSDREVTADTQFPLGSVSKSFTALAIMQLVEAGRVQLDARVSTYVEAFAEGPANDITILQLLNHTSGYSTVQGNSGRTGESSLPAALGENAAILAMLQPENAPGTVWEYSNANYQVLGAVIERVSGQSYADYVARYILEPLGMANTSIGGVGIPSDIAIGHRPWFGGVRTGGEPSPDLINAPAGGIAASASDMALYLAMWLNPEDDILSGAGKARMMQPSGPLSPNYGLGWSIDTHKRIVYHTGLVPGAEALASLDPVQGRAVAVMVNANGGFGFSDNWSLIGGVAARALGQPHDDNGSRWGPMMLYLSIALSPPLFLLLAVVSWRARSALRMKSESRFGLFSLWFPLVAMAGLAWFLVVVMPRLFGVSLATLQAYQPDFALFVVATAVSGLAWALFRLVLAHAHHGVLNRPV